MLIIVSAQVELDELQPLLDAYDVAKSEGERDQIAEQVGAMVGGTVQGMLRQKLRGLNLTLDEINALADEAIRSSLDGYGRTRLKRTDIIPERLVEEMRNPGNPWGQRLWNLLPADLQDELASTTYLKAPLAQRLVNEINRMIENPLFLKNLGVEGQSPSESAIERSYQHADALHRLSPEAVAKTEQADAKFMGFLSKYTLPDIRRRVRQSGDGSASEEIAKAWRRLQPVVEGLRNQSAGVEPTAREVQQAYRQKLADQFGPRLAWWEEQLRQVGRPFRLKDFASYNDAKEILAEHGYDEKQWETADSPYYLSKEFMKPYSISTVERAMKAFGTQGASGASWAPSATTSPPVSTTPEAQAPSWALEVGQQQGRGQDLYRAIVQSLYPDPESSERQIGELLSENASDETIDSYIRNVSEQDPDLADYLRSSWQAIARQIDNRVTEALRDPSIIGPIARQFGFSPSQLNAQRDGIRGMVFARRTHAISRSAAGIPARLGSSTVQLDGRGRAYLSASERIFSPVALEALRDTSEYLAGNPTPSEQQVREYLASLPEQVSSFVREVGWDKLSRVVDAAVIEMMSA